MIGFEFEVCFFEKRFFCFRKLFDESPCLLVSRGWVDFLRHHLLVSWFRYSLSDTAKVPPSVRKNFSQGIAFLKSSQESVNTLVVNALSAREGCVPLTWNTSNFVEVLEKNDLDRQNGAGRSLDLAHNMMQSYFLESRDGFWPILSCERE